MFVIAWVACVLGTLFTGPQAFGIVMVNFDEHVVDAHAALLGLFGFAAVSWVVLVTATLLDHRSRTHQSSKTPDLLLCAAIAVQIASVWGLTEHIGLALFS